MSLFLSPSFHLFVQIISRKTPLSFVAAAAEVAEVELALEPLCLLFGLLLELAALRGLVHMLAHCASLRRETLFAVLQGAKVLVLTEAWLRGYLPLLGLSGNTSV